MRKNVYTKMSCLHSSWAFLVLEAIKFMSLSTIPLSLRDNSIVSSQCKLIGLKSKKEGRQMGKKCYALPHWKLLLKLLTLIGRCSRISNVFSRSFGCALYSRVHLECQVCILAPRWCPLMDIGTSKGLVRYLSCKKRPLKCRRMKMDLWWLCYMTFCLTACSFVP